MQEHTTWAIHGDRVQVEDHPRLGAVEFIAPNEGRSQWIARTDRDHSWSCGPALVLEGASPRLRAYVLELQALAIRSTAEELDKLLRLGGRPFPGPKHANARMAQLAAGLVEALQQEEAVRA